MPYDLIPHPTDVALRVRSRTLPGLFAEATRACVAAVTDVAHVRAVEGRLVTVESPDLDTLLHDYLAELLRQIEDHRWVPADADAWLDTGDGVWRLEAHLRGEPRDAARHPTTNVITAVRSSGLTVARSADGWEADVELER